MNPERERNPVLGRPASACAFSGCKGRQVGTFVWGIGTMVYGRLAYPLCERHSLGFAVR